ncbi:MAG: hypothetical protein CMC04_07925 [Flavobacteriaceae bacterium]|nr:hypothetical protein [Flavobacteriaceae bacterium]|tara:strand:- start:1441 stop:1857 length:417 start_codon:yes stop_codon:yes gene_type:complete
MSWATCYSGNNNINFNYPPIMADGRNYSTWQPEAVINKRIQKSNDIKTNWGYRQFLQKNGLSVMNYNNLEACYDLGLDPHVSTNDTPSSNVPHKFSSIYDTNKPGFGYSNSDLKNPYLTREQLNARMIAPSIKMNNPK